MTTIYNPNIAAGDIISAGSLCLAELDCSEIEATIIDLAADSATLNGSADLGLTDATQSAPRWATSSDPSGAWNASAPNLNPLSATETSVPMQTPSLPPASAPVHGKAEFYRLLAMLFPHREALMAEWVEPQQSADRPCQGES
jgi:hypothetical protein